MPFVEGKKSFSKAHIIVGVSQWNGMHGSDHRDSPNKKTHKKTQLMLFFRKPLHRAR